MSVLIIISLIALGGRSFKIKWVNNIEVNGNQYVNYYTKVGWNDGPFYGK